MQDPTQLLLNHFERKFVAGPDVKAKLKAFAKHNKITQSDALWCIVHCATCTMDADDPDGSMDAYMSGWHEVTEK
jgi:hypothetical protein